MSHSLPVSQEHYSSWQTFLWQIRTQVLPWEKARSRLTGRTSVRYNDCMYTRIAPDTITRLSQMGEATIYEPAGDQPQQERRLGAYQSRSLAECITNVSTPTGKRPILKAMVTTACERNCYYCPFRAGRSKTKRPSRSASQHWLPRKSSLANS